MSRFTDPLEIGRRYERTELARLWELRGVEAIQRGVFTPAGGDQIFLFVTREKAGSMTRYDDFLDGDLLFWDGEERHGSDERIAQASRNNEEIHLFYRDQPRTEFTYCGRIVLIRWIRENEGPSQFVFSVVALAKKPEEELRIADELRGEAEDAAIDFAVLSAAGMNAIDRAVTTRHRGIAQRLFRGNLLRLWKGSCAVTSVGEARVLRSSHIKPWAESDVNEKVDHYNGLLLVPNLDGLLNEGLISFRNDGRIMISDNWQADDQRRMHVTGDLRLRQMHRESSGYLEFHRDCRFGRVGAGCAL